MGLQVLGIQHQVPLAWPQLSATNPGLDLPVLGESCYFLNVVLKPSDNKTYVSTGIYKFLYFFSSTVFFFPLSCLICLFGLLKLLLMRDKWFTCFPAGLSYVSALRAALTPPL